MLLVPLTHCKHNVTDARNESSYCLRILFVNGSLPQVKEMMVSRFKRVFGVINIMMGMLAGWATFFAFGSSAPLQGAHSATGADVVVYGATASGVMAAYSAAKQGLHVILLEPGAHLGGMVTGGLSATDVAHFQIIGGYPRAFYMKAAAHYGLTNLDQAQNWRSEPHVDEQIFTTMLHDAGVQVVFHEQLREKHGVEKRGSRVVALITADNKRWPAKVFLDCTYEGDLMAEAGVSYTWGREPESQYGESLAGVRGYTAGHQFAWPMSAYEKDHHLYPEVMPGPLKPEGTGDKGVEAYNFRLILTTNPADKLPFPKPQGYDPARFALLKEYLKEFPAHKGREPVVHDFFNPVMIPNSKADFNNNGPISTDYIGHSWAFPEASYAEKKKITEDHLLYTKSLVYFLANDPSVPASLRAELKTWGLPKDEFLDTGHWPNQLYIREARRMLGEYVMRQADLETDRTKPDSIAMGSYNADSHNVERVAQADGNVTNEGDIEVSVKPYEIPYSILVPKRSEIQNLLVSVCVSASHVAYSSIRMEPQYMMLGQAAGVAAALAVSAKTPVQDVPIADLQAKLRAEGAILHIDEQHQPGQKE